MFGKILVFDLLAKLLSTNQIAGFFKLEYLLNYMTCQLDFLYVDKDPLLLQTDYCGLTSIGVAVGVARYSQARPKCAEITNS